MDDRFCFIQSARRAGEQIVYLELYPNGLIVSYEAAAKTTAITSSNGPIHLK
jgi:hypothetical protein